MFCPSSKHSHCGPLYPSVHLTHVSVFVLHCQTTFILICAGSNQLIHQGKWNVPTWRQVTWHIATNHRQTTAQPGNCGEWIRNHGKGLDCGGKKGFLWLRFPIHDVGNHKEFLTRITSKKNSSTKDCNNAENASIVTTETMGHTAQKENLYDYMNISNMHAYKFHIINNLQLPVLSMHEKGALL
jgi:hypothetical protein